MNIEAIERTNYIKRASTWTYKSIGIYLIISLILLLGNDDDYLVLSIITLFIIVAIIIARVNDIAVDSKYLYHIRTSIIPRFSKVQKFEIEKMTSIRWKAYDSKFMRFMGTRTMSGVDYGIEISFDDNSSSSLDIDILKEDMDRVLIVVKRIIKNKSA